ncbi:MAG: aspartyl/glutamyl-tRNA amidotransferase subunit A [Candidatus Diapherotrites archaeon]|nr:aspartyl/glutamyl-tRNA amidotransferase subunit A [Candidatus Diapherotrites archaeon]
MEKSKENIEMSCMVDVTKFVKKAKSNKINLKNFYKKLSKKLRKWNSEYRHLVLINEIDSVEFSLPNGNLYGVPLSVKDCICVKGMESRAGSAILHGYKPTFNATAVQNALNNGAVIIGKTSQDEFGFGTFNVNVGKGFEIPLNPHDKKRSCGGSSGGAAGLTALLAMNKIPHLAIAESTGGSIACPASFCGVAGFTPTYGLVSRYGLIDYANSLDKIGAIARTTIEAALLLENIAGFDEKDSTSVSVNLKLTKTDTNIENLTLGIVKDFFSEGIDREVADIVWRKIKELEAKGVELKEVSLPLNAKYGLATYYIVAMSEASTNLAKYCGIRYGAALKLEGNFDEYFSKVRSKFFGEEAKRRIILGTFARQHGFRDAYYIRALKLRSKLIKEFKKVFKSCDVVVHPTMPIIAPRFDEIEKLTPLQNYAMDLCTVPANLAGLPHLSVNAGFSRRMPVGIMFTADHFNEEKLVKIGINAEEPIGEKE